MNSKFMDSFRKILFLQEKKSDEREHIFIKRIGVVSVSVFYIDVTSVQKNCKNPSFLMIP